MFRQNEVVPVSAAFARYRVMKSHFDLAPVKAFALRDGYLPDAATADASFDGLLQWLAAHAVDEHPDLPFVMMNGDVDQAFHAFLLNTRTYLHFCSDYVGFFIHHTPIMDVAVSEHDIIGGIGYTVNHLRSVYGDELSPALMAWALAHERGELTATSVSCVKNGPDRDAHTLIGVQDFRTFWDTNPQRTSVGTA